MKPKPRISKTTDGWQVTIPPFGFGPPHVKPGFPSWKAAGDWLAKGSEVGAGSQLVERASTVRSRHADMNVPMVVR